MPAGSGEVVLIFSGPGELTVTAAVAELTCCGTPESLTWNVTEGGLPGGVVCVGVPLKTPVAAFSVNPAGKLADGLDHVSGGVPPVAVSVVEYAMPTWIGGVLGSTGMVMRSCCGVIASDKTLETLSAGLLASVTLNVRETGELAGVGVVGVPLITPVDAFSDSPAGSVPEVSDHVYGVAPPVAVSVCE